MAKYKIVFAPTAAKQFRTLDKTIQIRVAKAIAKLADAPTLGKLLHGDLNTYRSYRIGDYRAIYFIRYQQVQIEIIRIAHRREVYKQ